MPCGWQENVTEWKGVQRMLRYEIKKVFSRTSGKIAVFLILCVLAAVSWIAVSEVSYINEQGEQETGIMAARRLRSAEKAWAGELTAERLREILAENRRINATPEAQSSDITQNNIAYSWKQGFREISYLFGYEGFRDWDYTRIDSLSADAAETFYDDRVALLEDYLNGEAADYFSEKEKEYLILQYQELETPLRYDYVEGWKQLFQYAPAVIILTVLILGFLVAGIFSCEALWGADSVFFTSCYGRDKAVAAKIQAGFGIMTGIYWAVVGIYSVLVLALLGADGADCQIQSTMAGWKSFYHLTNFQMYLLVIIGGYVGSLFILFVTMLVSARTESATVAVTIPFVLIFIPEFLSGIESTVLSKLLGILPAELLRMETVANYFNLYEIFGKIVSEIRLDMSLYPVLTIVLVPVLYLGYKKKEVR